jgi:hypothetical protein
MTATLARTPELADVVERFGPHVPGLSCEQQRVLRDIAACRTAALGGHMQTCDHCGHQRPAYNSCRNRHCPKCQASACADWLDEQAADLLPVEYFHVVFTLPDVFNSLALGNKRTVYGVLFKAVAQTLLEVAADPKRLGARIGFLAVLHTWGQNLSLHPHVHCVIPGGGLCPDGTRWVGCRPGFFLPVRVLSRVFRGKFIDLLRRAFLAGKLHGLGADALERLFDSAVSTDWVVYSKPPFGGPDQVLKYLSRYTHRIAISNRRILAMDDRTVTFQYKDYAHGNATRTMTLDGVEFLRRFLLHEVPRGFMRIRHFGILANPVKAKTLPQCRKLFGHAVAAEADTTGNAPVEPAEKLHVCPVCRRGRMVNDEKLLPQRFRPLCDSS